MIKECSTLEQCYTETPRVKKGDLQLLPDSEAVILATAAKALSDPIRVQMVHLLGQRLDLCTCEFEELLGLSQSKVSYHLKVLLEAGIVTRKSYSTWSHYSLYKQDILERIKALTL